MATAIWPRIRTLLGGKSSAQEDGLRRVTVRLAAQTVGLLLVMVIVLEVVVYLITQGTLQGSLESTLKSRAFQTDPTACTALHLSCAGRGPGGPGRGFGGPGGGPVGGQVGSPPQGGFNTGAPRADRTPSDASSVFVDPSVHVVHADGIISVVLDSQGARRALSTGRSQCCSTQSYKGQDYLVYTAPLFSGTNVAGAVQTTISEHQYENTMQALLQALLLVAVLGLLVSAGISAVLVRRSLTPIRAAVQRQRDFVADAAHELRTPLAIMRTVGEVGMGTSSVNELQATVEQMLGENQHLTRLVDDLSLLARTDTNAVAIERRPVNLTSLVLDTADELRYLAEEQGVALEADVQEGVQVTGDMLRLRQLLLILLDNALKHTPATGTVDVALSAQGGRVRLQVADTGEGINPPDLPQIFDRFYRAEKSRTGEGSGLGLAIGKWIVEAHGGTIHASNTSPHGALFTVSLPAMRASVPVLTTAPST